MHTTDNFKTERTRGKTTMQDFNEDTDTVRGPTHDSMLIS